MRKQTHKRRTKDTKALRSNASENAKKVTVSRFGLSPDDIAAIDANLSNEAIEREFEKLWNEDMKLMRSLFDGDLEDIDLDD